MDSENGNASRKHSRSLRADDDGGSCSNKHSRTRSISIDLSSSINDSDDNRLGGAGDGNPLDSDAVPATMSRLSSSSSSSSSSSGYVVEMIAEALKNQASDDHREMLENESSGPKPISQAPALGEIESVDPNIVSPSIQVMERSEGHDPNRIPASVFERNKSATMEWSVCSNESLFSIHVGANSFYKDSSFFYTSSACDEFSYTPPPPLPEEDFEIKSDLEKKVPLVPASDGKCEAKFETDISWNAHTNLQFNNSTLSDKSVNSRHSFSFPILGGGVAGDPVKVDAEEQNLQPEPESAPEPLPPTRWFYCLPIYPWCCSVGSCPRASS